MQLAIYVSVLLAIVTAPVGGTVPTSDVKPVEETQIQESGFDADRVLLRFDVRDDGSAIAHIEYRFALNRSNSTAAFENLQRDIEADQTAYLDRFERRINQTVQTANNSSSRVMDIQNVTVRAETRQLPQPYGVVNYTYTWNGFAAVENDRIRISDALAGLYLDDKSRLQISWPEGYHTRTVHDSASETRDRAAIWTGPTWFDRGGPRIVLARNGVPIDTIPVALLTVGLLCVAGGVVLWHSNGRAIAWLPTGSSADDRTPGPADEHAPTEPTTTSVDPELMSNEERILWEINQRGGRVKQQDLVTALGWSDSKVSRGVSALRERGEIERFRLGNENVLTVTDTDRGESP